MQYKLKKQEKLNGLQRKYGRHLPCERIQVPSEHCVILVPRAFQV